MVFEQIIDQVVARRRERDMGIMTLFGDAEGGDVFDERIAIPDVEFDKSRRLANEKEMLGLYISDHPLLGVEAALRRRCDATIADAETLDDGAVRNIGGVITGLQKKWTKKGELMAVFVLEDLVGSIEVMVFPRTMQEIGHKLEDDKVVMIRGRLDKRDDAPKLICMEVELFDADQISDAPPLRVRVSSAGLRPQLVAALEVAARRASRRFRGVHPPGCREGDPPARRLQRRPPERPCGRAARPARRGRCAGLSLTPCGNRSQLARRRRRDWTGRRCSERSGACQAWRSRWRQRTARL